MGLAAAGHTVHLLTDATDAPLPDLPAVMVRRIEAARPPAALAAKTGTAGVAGLLMRAAAVYREVRRIHEQLAPVDLVLAPLWDSEGAVCLLDRRFPTVVSCMTSLLTLAEVDPAVERLSDFQLRVSFERAALRRSAYLHGLTEAALSKAVRDYALQPTLATVIARGLPDRRIAPATPRRARGITSVLFVGRVERRKGTDVLLAAARRLLDDGARFRLLIAGPVGDPEIAQLFEREAAGSPAFRASVQMLGGVTDRERDRLYADCDIVCVPSRYESHGVVLIEALMFGKPIVTCDTGGITEVVEPGHTALVSASGDHVALAAVLRRALADAPLRARLGAAARESFERRFDVAETARRMQRFFADVVEVNAATGDEQPGGSLQAGLESLLHDGFALSGAKGSAIASELLAPGRGSVARRVRARLRTAARAPAPAE